MSHFVSSHTSHDFDALQNQLLRREPVQDGLAADEQPLYSDDARETSGAGLGAASSLANRRRRDPDDFALTADDNRSQRVPSLYSRRNSPELPEPGPSRPRSVAGNVDGEAAAIGCPRWHHQR